MSIRERDGESERDATEIFSSLVPESLGMMSFSSF